MLISLVSAAGKLNQRRWETTPRPAAWGRGVRLLSASWSGAAALSFV